MLPFDDKTNAGRNCALGLVLYLPRDRILKASPSGLIMPSSTIEHNRSVRVFPRRKKSDDASTQVTTEGTKRKRGNTPVELTVARISTVLHMPQAKAARAMGISATALKSVCRRLGIRSWPNARWKKETKIRTSLNSLGKFDEVSDQESQLSFSATPRLHPHVPCKPIQFEASTDSTTEMDMPSGCSVKPSPSCVVKYCNENIPVSCGSDCTSTPIKHALSDLSTLGSESTCWHQHLQAMGYFSVANCPPSTRIIDLCAMLEVTRGWSDTEDLRFLVASPILEGEYESWGGRWAGH